jgi:hypothetical protein
VVSVTGRRDASGAAPAVVLALVTGASAGAAAGQAADTVTALLPGDPSVKTLVFAATVFLAILLLGLLARAVGERRKGTLATQVSDVSDVAEVTGKVEGTLLRFAVLQSPERPPLPGRLEVVSGDGVVREVPLYAARGQSFPEVTLGRLAGAPLCHIEVRSTVVGGRHAKLSFVDGRWLLANLARPPRPATRFRGEAMALDQQVALGDGDEFEIGPATFVFRA